jgi:hypothetical protein
MHQGKKIILLIPFSDQTQGMHRNGSFEFAEVSDFSAKDGMQ